jgi:hypothetical protein
MVKVYKMPPVSVYGTEWTPEFMVSRSTSYFTSKRYISSFQRPRIKAVLEVAGLGLDDVGAGYVEAMKLVLKGGENLMRLDSTPAYRGKTSTAGQIITIEWDQAGTPVTWRENGTNIVFSQGTVVLGEAYTLNGMPAIYIENLPALKQFGKPSDFVRWIPNVGDPVILQSLSNVITNSKGRANILSSVNLVAGDGSVEFGHIDSQVFEPDAIPRSLTPVNGDWVYRWDFTQVFEDETDGFMEMDPWVAVR